jgi:hypothetical protein
LHDIKINILGIKSANHNTVKQVISRLEQALFLWSKLFRLSLCSVMAFRSSQSQYHPSTPPLVKKVPVLMQQQNL